MSAPRWRTHAAVRGFDRAAETYERARPGYPAAAVGWLARALDLGPGRTVVELASGTGKFTRALRPVGAAIVGVEPTAGMRAVFERTVPDVAVVAGTAEAIPLPEAFADAVVAAQAFHWFRPRAALEEIARVLRPGGRLGLVWNLRDETVPYSHRLSEIMRRYRGSVPGTPGPERGGSAGGRRRWQAAFDRPGGPFGRLHHRRFSHRQRLDPDGIVDRVLSVSVIAVLPASERRKITREVRVLLEEDPATRGRRSIELPYWTDAYWAPRC
ncbi:MAG: class I SAM-dependent methyltransferase [Thermoplasmata archaeon]